MNSVISSGYTLTTDAKSEYYRTAKDNDDALNWDDESFEVAMC